MGDVKKYRFEQFAATRLFYPAVAYSPDGNAIAHINNTTGQFNLWTVPSGGGYPRQLTAFMDNTVRTMAWSPDGTQLVFQADQNGDEQHQLYLIGSKGGWPEALTNNLKAQFNLGLATWSPDGKTIAHNGNDLNPAVMDVILRDMTTGETRRPLPSGGIFTPAFWSPDGKFLTIVEETSNTNQLIFLLNVESGEVTKTTPHEGEIIFLPGPWKRDGSGFYFFTNQGREFTGMAFYDVRSGTWDWVETPGYDIENMSLAARNDVMVWSVNEDGASRLRGRDLQSGAALKMPDLHLGVISGMSASPDGTRAALIFARPGEASNLYGPEHDRRC
jgi:WD40 repeat protein